MIQMSLQGTVPLDALLRYVSQRLKINYDYSTEIGKQTITIQTPAEIPVRSLPLLVSSALRSAGLALVDSDVPGWKRIVNSNEMVTHAPFGNAEAVLQQAGPGAPVTQLFLLKRYTADTVGKLITPFQTQQGGKLSSLTESNILIITDYAANIKKISEFIELIDKTGETVFEFYEVKNQKSKDLTERVQQVLGGRSAVAVPSSTADGDGAAVAPPMGASGNGAAGSQTTVRFFDDPLANRVVVVGRRDLVAEAIALLQRFDVSLEMETKFYRPKNMTAERLKTIVEGYLPPQDKDRAFDGTVDEAGNMLVVRATADIHRKIEEVLNLLDQTPTSADNPIQIYKLMNAKAEDVLATLLALQEAYGMGMGGGNGVGGQFFGGSFGFGIPMFPGAGMGTLGGGGLGYPMGYNRMGAGAGAGFEQPGMGGFGQLTNQGPMAFSLPSQMASPTPSGSMLGTGNNFSGSTSTSTRGGRQSQRGGAESGMGGYGGGLGGGFGGGSAYLPYGARVSADVATNSLIIVAPANVHPIYERLIKMLDQRRPQVLIEAKFIALNTSDGFQFGVEVSGGDRTDPKKKFSFTSFGLSQVDPKTGALTITPGRGFNGTVVNPEVADVVVRALATHRRARILSAPKIMVNDNETGTLESLESVSYASQNTSVTGNQSLTVGGTQEAGTTILVTPHINEDNNLQLEFEIEFSTFVGTGSADGLPPNRRIEKVSSVVTVPDGQTVIVGGLNRSGESREYFGVPWVEKIPIVRDLFGRTDEGQDKTSFFVFIRPLIMRDSEFRDLQFLSDRQSGLVGIPSEYPASEPVLIPALCPPQADPPISIR
jgi:type II secretory pathway component GspD/PulD (secretin)